MRHWEFVAASIAVILVSACAQPPGAVVAVPEPAGEENRIVAFVNRKPIERRDLLRMAALWHEKEYLEEYIVWELIRQKKAELGIVHTPEELAMRADTAMRQIRQDFGETSFVKHLQEKNITEQDLKNTLINDGNLGERFANEKMTVYALLSEETIDLDLLIFPDEEGAKAFLRKIDSRDDRFERERLILEEDPHNKVQYIRTKPFPRGMGPTFLSEQEEKELFAMEEGEVSNPIFCRVCYLVARVRAKSKGKPAPYKELLSQILERILSDPPGDDIIRKWIERLRKRVDVKYENRSPKRN